MSNENPFERTVPSYLTHRGKPNLIIAPHSTQITATLSIYAISPQCPLPSSDEVLYCSSEIGCDQIESFLRFAISSNDGKIYTLVHGEKLNLDTSKHANQCLQTLKTNEKYMLVIICSDDQSPLASSFALNKVDWKYDASEKKELIKTYLSSKLQEQCSNSIDPEKFSVRALISNRAGCGKTLFVKELKDHIEKMGMSYNIIPVKYRRLDKEKIIEKLFQILQEREHKANGHVFHIDIAYEVEEELEHFLFNLIVLGVVKHQNGLEWRRSNKDFYFIEKTLALDENGVPFHSVFDLIPSIFFRDPQTYLSDLERNIANTYLDKSFSRIYISDSYQCVCSCIKIWDDQKSANGFKFYGANALPPISEQECLKLILGQLENPIWMEVSNYVRFLNEQLYYADHCNTFNIITGFKAIYLELLKIMGADIALPSLNWSDSNHPFIIFNADSINRCICDPSNHEKCFQLVGINISHKDYIMFDSLSLRPVLNQSIPFEMRIKFLERHYSIYRHFNEYPRGMNIENIRKVFSLNVQRYGNREPDPSYALTLDNNLKLMKIYLKLRSNIPVVIIGESGCGKTRTIKFLGDMHILPHRSLNNENFQILIHVQIDAGTTAETIQVKLNEAVELSKKNFEQLYPEYDSNSYEFGYVPLSAILFFDGANNTEVISLIKEIMCDGTCEGDPIDLSYGLKIIAACNRLKPIPPTLLHLAWDFGVLNNNFQN